MIGWLVWFALELLGRNVDRRHAVALDSISEKECKW